MAITKEEYIKIINIMAAESTHTPLVQNNAIFGC